MRDDGQPSSAKILYGASLKLPQDLLVEQPTQNFLNPRDYASRLMQHMRDLKPIQTRHNRTCKSYVNKNLKNSSMVFVRNNAKKGLSPNYKGPYKVIYAGENFFTIKLDNGSTDNVSIDRIKPAFTQEEAMPLPVPRKIPIPMSKNLKGILVTRPIFKEINRQKQS